MHTTYFGSCLALLVAAGLAAPCEAHPGRRQAQEGSLLVRGAKPAPSRIAAGSRVEPPRQQQNQQHAHQRQHAEHQPHGHAQHHRQHPPHQRHPGAHHDHVFHRHPSVPSRVVVVAPPAAVRYVPVPVTASAPVYVAPPPQPPAAPAGPPEGTWRPVAGPYLAVDGASFVAGGVSYVLSGLLPWDAASPRGAAARARLQQLLDAGRVSVWRIATDGYGRAIVRVSVDGVEIAQILRGEGYSRA